MLVITWNSQDYVDACEKHKTSSVPEDWFSSPRLRGVEAVSMLMPLTASQASKLKLAAFSYPEKVIVVQQFTEIGERWHKVLKQRGEAEVKPAGETK